MWPLCWCRQEHCSIGDIMLAGHHFGKVKAMYNERGKKITAAGPSDPVLVLGFEWCTSGR